MESSNTSKIFLEYKDKPLVRSGNIIYYGNSNDKFIVKMNIKESIKDKKSSLNISSNIDVQLIDNSKGFYQQKVVKTSSKDNLCVALDIADIWLERALTD